MSEILIHNAQDKTEERTNYVQEISVNDVRSIYFSRNKVACEESIIKTYDEFAQRNIADLRTNLDTGQPYTAEDLATMNSFIDSKRTLYKQYKDAITAATTIEELQAIDLNYDN